MHTHDNSRLTPATTLLAGAVLFAAALLLRVWTLNWGLPYVEHPDEPALLAVALRMVQEGDPNPRNFIYPSFYFYLLAIVTRAYAEWGISQGLYQSLADLPLRTDLYTLHPDLYIWNRALTATLSAATIPALFLLGQRMFNWQVGLLAALTLAVARFHVEHSYYITTDAPTGLWVTLALLGAWEIARNGGWRGYVLAGIAAGLAAATKYNAGIVALAPTLAHALHWWPRPHLRPFARLWLCGALALLAFIITSPYVVLDWRAFLAGLRFNTEHYGSGSHGDFIGTWNVAGYARFVWNRGLYAGGTLLLLLGLPLLLRHTPRQTLLLLSVSLAGFLVLMTQSVNFVRNVLPVFPLLILLTAASVAALSQWLQKRLEQPVRLRAAYFRRMPLDTRVLGVFLIALVLYPQVRDTAWLLRYWSQPHTLVAAAEDVRALPQGMRIAVEMNPVQWADQPLIFPVRRLTNESLEWYRANGFRYLIANGDRRTPQDRELYATLRAESDVLATYPERRLGMRPGPGVEILDLGESVAAMAFTRHQMTFDERIELLGYEIQPGSPRSQSSPLEGADTRVLYTEEGVQVNLYWRALAAMEQDYVLFLHVIDAQGAVVAQRDLPLRYGDYPTSHWQPGELVIDRADLTLPALPPDEYRLELGLYDPNTLARLPLTSPDTTNLLLVVTVR